MNALNLFCNNNANMCVYVSRCKRFSVRGIVLAPQYVTGVPAFLQQLYSVLQCCPNLWTSTRLQHCPLNCQQVGVLSVVVVLPFLCFIHIDGYIDIFIVIDE